MKELSELDSKVPGILAALPRDLVSKLILICYPQYPLLYKFTVLQNLEVKRLLRFLFTGYLQSVMRYPLEFPTMLRWEQNILFSEWQLGPLITKQLAKGGLPAEARKKNFLQQYASCRVDYYKDREGDQSLFAAVASGSLDLVKTCFPAFTPPTGLLKFLETWQDESSRNRGIQRPRRHDRFTPLHLACYLGYPDIAVYLLKHEAEPGAYCAAGYVPLFYAVLNGHRSTVKALMQIDKVKNTAHQTHSKNPIKISPYLMAVENDMDDLFEEVAINPIPRECLRDAITMGYERLIARIEPNPDKAFENAGNYKYSKEGSYSISVLNVVVSLDRLEMAKKLFHAGAKPNLDETSFRRVKIGDRNYTLSITTLGCARDLKMRALICFVQYSQYTPMDILHDNFSIWMDKGLKDGKYRPIDTPFFAALKSVESWLREGETFGCEPEVCKKFLAQFEAFKLIAEKPEIRSLINLSMAFKSDADPELKAEIFWRMADLTKNKLEQEAYLILAFSNHPNRSFLISYLALNIIEDGDLIDAICCNFSESPRLLSAKILLQFMGIYRDIKKNPLLLAQFSLFLSALSEEKLSNVKVRDAIYTYGSTFPKPVNLLFFTINKNPACGYLNQLSKLIVHFNDIEELRIIAKLIYPHTKYKYSSIILSEKVRDNTEDRKGSGFDR